MVSEPQWLYRGANAINGLYILYRSYSVWMERIVVFLFHLVFLEWSNEYFILDRKNRIKVTEAIQNQNMMMITRFRVSQITNAHT